MKKEEKKEEKEKEKEKKRPHAVVRGLGGTGVWRKGRMASRVSLCGWGGEEVMYSREASVASPFRGF
jgi:hypothetical protein